MLSKYVLKKVIKQERQRNTGQPKVFVQAVSLDDELFC